MIFVQYLRNIWTIFAQYLHNICTIFAYYLHIIRQYSYNDPNKFAQYLLNIVKTFAQCRGHNIRAILPSSAKLKLQLGWVGFISAFSNHPTNQPTNHPPNKVYFDKEQPYPISSFPWLAKIAWLLSSAPPSAQDRLGLFYSKLSQQPQPGQESYSKLNWRG